jgi:outer membrane protein TolC
MKLAGLFSFIVLALEGTAAAAEPTAMSLPDALAYARAHQPAIRAAEARIRAEKANAEVPRSQWSPQLGITGQLLGGTANNSSASYFTVPTVDLPRIGGTRSKNLANANWKPYASSLIGVGGSQELFDFGRIAAQTAAADAIVEVRRKDADAERLDIELDVEEAFFAVTAARAVLVASEGAFERASVHRDLAKAGVTSGLRSPIELTRAEADLQRFEIGRVRARGGLLTAQSVLAAAIGSPEPAIDAGAGPSAPSDMPALGAAIQQATARDPHLQAMLARLKAEEAQTKAVGAELRPDIALSATLSGRAGGTAPSSGPTPDGAGFLPTIPNYDIGVVLSWPLLDGTISARRDAAKAHEEVGREEVEVARQTLAATVQQAYVAVDVARTALPSLQREVEASIANYAQADARFKAGLGTSVELADAESLRASAEIDLAIGAFELAKARAAFGRAIAEGH